MKFTWAISELSRATSNTSLATKNSYGSMKSNWKMHSRHFSSLGRWKRETNSPTFQSLTLCVCLKRKSISASVCSCCFASIHQHISNAATFMPLIQAKSFTHNANDSISASRSLVKFSAFNLVSFEFSLDGFSLNRPFSLTRLLPKSPIIETVIRFIHTPTDTHAVCRGVKRDTCGQEGD